MLELIAQCHLQRDLHNKFITNRNFIFSHLLKISFRNKLNKIGERGQP